MPYNLRLSDSLESQGWKVKIREKERLEPPHVTVIKGTKSWRWSLREKSFMDKKPFGSEVPADLVEMLIVNYEVLKREWDKKYPYNKV